MRGRLSGWRSIIANDDDARTLELFDGIESSERGVIVDAEDGVELWVRLQNVGRRLERLIPDTLAVHVSNNLDLRKLCERLLKALHAVEHGRHRRLVDNCNIALAIQYLRDVLSC